MAARQALVEDIKSTQNLLHSACFDSPASRPSARAVQ
jgi:hypothetical protein